MEPREEDGTYFDVLLKRLMSNITVMRRFIFGAYFMFAVGLTVVVILNDNWHDTTLSAERAVCNVVEYAERQADLIRLDRAEAAEGLDRLAGDMRRTGVHCPPQKPVAAP